MFDFGSNWKAYSETVLDPGRLEAAKRSLADLLGPEAFRGKTVLDVGCGTGIFSIGASLLGAKRVLGADINETCIAVSRKNAAAFAPGPAAPEFTAISILDGERTAALGQFDIVYAWGSLHHTGDMRTAIGNAASRVAPGGTFVLAIYNRHVSSPLWRIIKWSYNVSPAPVKTLLYYAFVPVIFLLKFLVTGANPLRKERGMDFFFDVKDWIGGYPYEYASAAEIEQLAAGLGFERVRTVPGRTSLACNEFVFTRKEGA